MNWKNMVPVKQKTSYRNSNGELMNSEWRMLFGKPFCVKHTKREES